MNRTDNSRFLLYIEPSKEEKSETPVEDELTMVMQLALSQARSGTSNYSETGQRELFDKGSSFRGYHRTDCGKTSSPNDFLLKNKMITNSLCVFYLRYYRNSIPGSEMRKVHSLVAFYRKKYPRTLEAVAARAVRDEAEFLRDPVAYIFTRKRPRYGNELPLGKLRGIDPKDATP